MEEKIRKEIDDVFDKHEVEFEDRIYVASSIVTDLIVKLGSVDYGYGFLDAMRHRIERGLIVK